MTRKFLGWSLFDRYRSTLVTVAVIYLLPIPALVIWGAWPFPLLLFLGFVLLDVFLLIYSAYRLEKKDLALQLKGEILGFGWNIFINK